MSPDYVSAVDFARLEAGVNAFIQEGREVFSSFRKFMEARSGERVEFEQLQNATAELQEAFEAQSTQHARQFEAQAARILELETSRRVWKSKVVTAFAVLQFVGVGLLFLAKNLPAILAALR